MTCPGVKLSFFNKNLGSIFQTIVLFYIILIISILLLNIIATYSDGSIPSDVMKPINITGIVLVSISLMVNVFLSMYLVRREHKSASIFNMFKEGFWNGVRSFYFFFGGTIILLLTEIVLIRYLSQHDDFFTIAASIILYILVFFYYTFKYDIENRIINPFYELISENCKFKRQERRGQEQMFSKSC